MLYGNDETLAVVGPSHDDELPRVVAWFEEDAVHGCFAVAPHPWHRGIRSRQDDRGVAVDAEKCDIGGQHILERRRPPPRPSLCREQCGNRLLRMGGEHVAPTEFVQGGSELPDRSRIGQAEHRRGEQFDLVGVHQETLGKFSRRDATMSRWISAVPP